MPRPHVLAHAARQRGPWLIFDVRQYLKFAVTSKEYSAKKAKRLAAARELSAAECRATRLLSGRYGWCGGRLTGWRGAAHPVTDQRVRKKGEGRALDRDLVRRAGPLEEGSAAFHDSSVSEGRTPYMKVLCFATWSRNPNRRTRRQSQRPQLSRRVLWK